MFHFPHNRVCIQRHEAKKKM